MNFKTTHTAGDGVASRAAGLCLATAMFMLAIVLVAAPPVFAEAPSAQDQYLEVVPDADGSQSPEEFSRSLGGDGGPVTQAQIERLARQNARRRGHGRSDDARASDRAEANSEAPANLEAVATAASKQPLSGGFAIILALAVALTAAAGLLLRRRTRA
ncbi:MAG: hypothetical protein HY827_07085 [Actinobacteria bacterium]|nr:hypothetical protein [Actinomycetota bacterium]